MTWTRKQPGQTNSPATKRILKQTRKLESQGNQTIFNLGMGTPSQEYDDELVRLGASSFQSGNFRLFLLLFFAKPGSRDAVQQIFHHRFYLMPRCVNNVSSVKRKNSVRRKIARCFLQPSLMIFFLQKPGSRDAVEQSCNRLTISLHHNNSKSSGTQSSKVTCVDYLLFVCLLSKIVIDCFSFSETFSSLSFQKDRSVFPQQANLVPVNLGTPSS